MMAGAQDRDVRARIEIQCPACQCRTPGARCRCSACPVGRIDGQEIREQMLELGLAIARQRYEAVFGRDRDRPDALEQDWRDGSDGFGAPGGGV